MKVTSLCRLVCYLMCSQNTLRKIEKLCKCLEYKFLAKNNKKLTLRQSGLWRCKIKSFYRILLGAFVLVSLGCASVERTTLIGVGSGALGGAIAAMSLDKNEHENMNTKGAVTGALLGGLVAYVIHRVIEKKEDRVRRETLFNLESHGVAVDFNSKKMKRFNTFMTSPEVREDYIETHTADDGRKLIQGHKTWTILGRPHFNLSNTKREGNN